MTNRKTESWDSRGMVVSVEFGAKPQPQVHEAVVEEYDQEQKDIFESILPEVEEGPT